MTPDVAWTKLEVHCDGCDECFWFTLQFCLVGQELKKQWALACASHGQPIAQFHRSGARA